MAKMNWNRPRKYNRFEEKYEPGIRLNNGRRVFNPHAEASKRSRKWEREAVKSLASAARIPERGIDVVQIAKAIYGTAVAGDINKIPKSKRQEMLRAYRERQAEKLSPAEEYKLSAIIEQLRPRP